VSPSRQHERQDLEQQYGPFPHWLQQIALTDETLWHAMRSPEKRSGEVVYVLQTAPDEVLVHTKGFYPAGTYRLPSGTICPGESVEEALHREVREETGLEVQIARVLGLIEYEFRYGDERIPFASWALLVQPTSRQDVRVADPAEDIQEFRSVQINELRGIARHLRSLPGTWHDWGRFRATVHDLVALQLGAC
jgi:8-oxo-dGTP pyrophosphatase MutT (NUDIX family)